MILVNNRDKVAWEENMTVKDLLKKMGYTFFLLTVTINDELIPREDYSETIVPDDSRVIIFHLYHGG